MDVNAIVSTAAGGVISALISGIFYWLGGRDLAKEATQLHELNVLLLRAFEEAGFARLNRDASGKPIGLVLDGAAVMELTSASDSCDASIIRAAEQTNQAEESPKSELSNVARRSQAAAAAWFGPIRDKSEASPRKSDGV